jgi:hypothetical protein
MNNFRADRSNFIDISIERNRTYTYPDGSTVVITQPSKLCVSKSGGHRIADCFGHGHYVAPGWNHIHWTTNNGRWPFVA